MLEVTDQGVELAGRVPAGYLYVDGIVGDVGSGVLRDRRVLASEGVVVVVVTVDTQTGKVLVGPEIITRGLGLRAGGRGPPRRGVRHDRRRRRDGPGRGRARRRGARARRAAGGRQVRQRAHPPPADDRARRDGGVSARRRVVGCRRHWVVAGCVLLTTTCGGDDDDAVRPVLDQIAPAIAAVEAELGGPQQYFEINATPQVVNLFVATDDATTVTPYVYVGGELASTGRAGDGGGGDVRGRRARRSTRRRSSTGSPTSCRTPTSCCSRSSAARAAPCSTRPTVQSEAGGTLEVVLDPDGTVRSVDPGS